MKIFSFVVMLVRAVFEVLIEVTRFTLHAVLLLSSLRYQGWCWILRSLCGRTKASGSRSIRRSSLNSQSEKKKTLLLISLELEPLRTILFGGGGVEQQCERDPCGDQNDSRASRRTQSPHTVNVENLLIVLFCLICYHWSLNDIN